MRYFVSVCLVLCLCGCGGKKVEDKTGDKTKTKPACTGPNCPKTNPAGTISVPVTPTTK